MRRKRKDQTGYVYRERDFWYVRYYDDRVIDGQLCRKRIAKKVVAAAGITAKKAREMAAEQLADIIKPQLSPETALTLEDFVEKVYFRRIPGRLRPSTQRGYLVIWHDQLKPYCAGFMAARCAYEAHPGCARSAGPSRPTQRKFHEAR